MSRRQSVPSNMFYRKADPFPPNFPTPEEGDFYYNTTRNVIRIYLSIEGSDPVQLVWQDLVLGSGGPVGDKYYEHVQNTASPLWLVTHNLEKKPSVTVTDPTGHVMYGSIAYTNDNSLTISFATSITGKAYCS